MTGQFPSRYSEDQRAAVAHAYNVQKLRPVKRIAELAKAGRLRDEFGEELPAFEVALATIPHLARRARRKAAGTDRKGLATVPHETAMEAMRKRLVAIAEHEIDRMERAQRGKKAVKLADIREAARLLRELAAMPADGSRPAAPGKVDRTTGTKNGDATRGGKAGTLLAEHRASRPAASDQRDLALRRDPQHVDVLRTSSAGEERSAGEALASGEAQNAGEDGGPGSAGGPENATPADAAASALARIAAAQTA